MEPHATASLLRPGDIFGGHRVVRLIGTGGFSEVYEALGPAGEPRALKVLTSRAPAGSKLRARLTREADILVRVQHPSVVRFHGAGVEHDAAYFVLELVEGTTLAEQLRSPQGLPTIESVLRWLIQACEGIAEAHRVGVIHRDLKPANILITRADEVKVIDFGVAKWAYLGARATSGSNMMGTALYMAPEQIQGRAVDERADVYAMGVILYEALAGVHPIGVDGEMATPLDVLQHHLLSEPRPLCDIAPEVSPELAALVHRALDKNPERRVSSMRELADGLRAALDDLQAVPSGLIRKLTALARGDALPDERLPFAETIRIDTSREALPPSAPRPDVPLSAPPRTTLKPPMPVAADASPSHPSQHHGSSLPIVSNARPTTAPRRPWRIALAAAAALCALAAGTFSAIRAPHHAQTPAPTTTPAPTMMPAPATRTDWLDAGERLVVEADVDGDATLDLVGYCGSPESGSVCAYAGTTFQPLWRTSPSNQRHPRGALGVAGRSVAYADPRAIVHVLDLSTGAARGEVPLGSRAHRVCAAPDAPGKLWFELEDGRGMLLDPAAVQVTAGPLPDACKPPSREIATVLVKGGPLRIPASFVARVPGFAARATRIDRGHGVELGVEPAGSTVPIILGFTPGQHGPSSLRWKRPLLPGDGLGGHSRDSVLELGGGRAVTAYEDLAGAEHLVAVDAATGKTLWDVEARTPLWMMVSATRVYARRNGHLAVRDAATGALLGAVGQP